MNFSLLQDSIASWGAALLLSGVSIAALYAVRYLLLCRLRAIAARTETRLGDFVVTVLSSTHTLSIWAIGAYLGSQMLALTPYQSLMVTRVVALATQNILGDLFASLSIMLDKPFELGDFIIVGDVLGWVEHIGLKTTRVRGLGGEQVVFSNGELLKSRIHNHKRLERRRVAFGIRVAYGTPDAQLAAIPAMVRDIVGAHPVDFEHCHFMSYGDWSLNFEVVYHFRNPDWFAHLDTQQEIFLELYRRFAQHGIQFAHPMSIVRVFDGDPERGVRPAPPPVSPAQQGSTKH